MLQLQPGKENRRSIGQVVTKFSQKTKMDETVVRTPLRDVNRRAMPASAKKSTKLFTPLRTPSGRKGKHVTKSSQKSTSIAAMDVYCDDASATPKQTQQCHSHKKAGLTQHRVAQTPKHVVSLKDVCQSQTVCSPDKVPTKSAQGELSQVAPVITLNDGPSPIVTPPELLSSLLTRVHLDDSLDIKSLVYEKVVNIVDKLQNEIDDKLVSKDVEIARLQEQVNILQESPSHCSFVGHAWEQNNGVDTDVESFVNEVLENAISQLQQSAVLKGNSPEQLRLKHVRFSTQSPVIINRQLSEDFDSSIEVLSSPPATSELTSLHKQISYDFKARISAGFSPNLTHASVGSVPLSICSPLAIDVSPSPTLLPMTEVLAQISTLSEHNARIIESFQACTSDNAADKSPFDDNQPYIPRYMRVKTKEVMTSPLISGHTGGLLSYDSCSPVQFVNSGTTPMTPLKKTSIGCGMDVNFNCKVSDQMTTPTLMRCHETMTSPPAMATHETMVTPVKSLSFGQVTTPVRTTHRGVGVLTECRSQGSMTEAVKTRNFTQNVNLFHREKVNRQFHPVMTISRGVMTSPAKVADVSQLTTPVKARDFSQCVTPVSTINTATTTLSPGHGEISIMTTPVKMSEADTLTSPGLGFDHPITMRQQINNFHSSIVRLESEMAGHQQAIEERDVEIGCLHDELTSYKEMCSKLQDNLAELNQKLARAKETDGELHDVTERLKFVESQSMEHMEFMEQERRSLLASLQETEDTLNATTLDLSRSKVAFFEKARMCQGYEKTVKELSENQQALQSELDSTKAHAHFMLLSQATEIQDSSQEARQILASMKELLDKIEVYQEPEVTVKLEPPQLSSTQQGSSFVSSILGALNDTPQTDSCLATPLSPISELGTNNVIFSKPAVSSQLRVSETSAFSQVQRVGNGERSQSGSSQSDGSSEDVPLTELVKELRLAMSQVSEAVKDRFEEHNSKLEQLANLKTQAEGEYKRKTQGLKDQIRDLERQLEDKSMSERHARQEVVSVQAKLTECREELEHTNFVLKENASNIGRYTDQSDEIRKLSKEVARLTKYCCDTDNENAMLSQELKSALQRMVKSENDQQSVDLSGEILTVKRENQKLREKLLEKKDYLDKTIATANRRMTAYESNWRQAEQEIRQLDQLVEKVRQTLKKNQRLVNSSEELKAILQELDGSQVVSPTRLGKESDV